uniref:Zinc_ribbon_2 domain-containing protein n=1 Tax=Taenia asiatica TaxID=60517 RepID=A0A0R3WAJ0_TAEAS
LSNTTRSLESPTAIRTAAKRPSSRSSSQKRSSMSSANAERGTKNRGSNVTSKREPLVGRQGSQTRGTNRGFYCHECGAKFPSTSARFCPDCGVRRMAV